ncbi:MAG: ATP-binding protein [Lachnospiraceae bacterium]|jgi:hypothetical protein|nr:ATP-binding protein [Lachnospiraceae bacterium]
MAYDKTKKQIKDGNPDFRSLITTNGLYIDKTRFIEELENIGDFNLMLRPKRFGKSLFTSMLMYYYDVRYADEFDTLFGGLYIHEHKTHLANTYNVLKFDFSGIESESGKVKPQFKETVIINLESFARRNKIEIEIDKTAPLNILTRNFLINYRDICDTKIYLLIDEYDNFANAVLGSDFNYFKDITSKSGFVRSFYEVFKEFSGNLIERVYITGVTPITLDALASGFNYVINRSLDPRLNNMIGFTESEVDSILDYYGINISHKNVLREYYNGYIFNTINANIGRIYNSTLVFYYLAFLIGNEVPPPELVDSRVQSDPGTVRRLIDLLGDHETKLKILETIQQKEDLALQILLKFKPEEFMENKTDLVTMLYYLGFLTVKNIDAGRPVLGVPNRTIEMLYSELYLGYLNRLLLPTIDDLHGAVTSLVRKGDTQPFICFLHKNLSLLDDFDFSKMNEQGIKNFIIAYLRLYQNIHLETEIDVEKGRIDLAILPTPLYTFSHYYVIEIKYISKAKDSEAVRTQKRQEALAQLNNYKTSQKLTDAEKFVTIHKLYMRVIKDEVDIEEVL